MESEQFARTAPCRGYRDGTSVGLGHRDKLSQAGPVVLLVVVLHNAIGDALGYATGIATGQAETTSRTMAVEVGRQNSGLAATLSASYLSPLAALLGAVFSVWHNVSDAVLALIFRAHDRRSQEASEQPER